MVIPFTIAFFMIFENQKEQFTRDSIKNMEHEMIQQYAKIQKTVEMCSMSSQVFINNQELKDFLVKSKKGEKISTEELVEFYRKDIGTLEKLVNSNPYLYQTRVYAYSEEILEMLPILFSKKSMETLPWKDSYQSGEWQFDYQDSVWEEGGNHSSHHIMSLVTVLDDYDLQEIGVLEVAVDMVAVFPDIFDSDGEHWECFVDQYHTIYAGTAVTKERCAAMMEDERVKIKISEAPDEAQFFYLNGDQHLLIGYVPVKELSGYVMRMTDLEKPLHAINIQRNKYLAGMLVIFVVLFFIINFIIRVLLAGFYNVIATIRQVQAGNLDVSVVNCGQDEIGELGHQINKMLARIKVLMQENIDRELLVKDSEIRALQNQINAHFIYNVLESIKMMAEIREEYDISDAVTSLGRLLRYSMKWVSGNVTIEQEIQYIKDYIRLMNLRFDYQIQLNIKIPETLMIQEIPKMSLQPIIENAICHGIEELAEDAVISIKGIQDQTYCRIEITDSGIGMSEEQVLELEHKIHGEKTVQGEKESHGGSGNGIGLKNVQDRIAITFGEAYGIQIVSKEQCFTKVIVCIPLTHMEGIVNDENTGGGR